MTLCHATHSEKNQYVEITISERALKAHQRHQDGEDIVPAPAGGCPGPTAVGSTQPGSPPAPAPDEPSGGPPVTSQLGPTEPGPASGTLGERAQGGKAGERAQGDTPSGDPAGRVAGANAAGGSGGNLPFTGLGLLALIALGTASLLSGVGIRKAIGRS